MDEVKVILLGDAGVGKTSLINCFLQEGDGLGGLAKRAGSGGSTGPGPRSSHYDPDVRVKEVRLRDGKAVKVKHEVFAFVYMYMHAVPFPQSSCIMCTEARKQWLHYDKVVIERYHLLCNNKIVRGTKAYDAQNSLQSLSSFFPLNKK